MRLTTSSLRAPASVRHEDRSQRSNPVLRDCELLRVPWMRAFVASLLATSFIINLSGCQTAPHKPVASRAETISALARVTQGLTNKTVTQAQLKDLSRQIANDPQAQSALRSINTALSPWHVVKYCPENGERFSAEVIWCPDHKVKLEWVE